MKLSQIILAMSCALMLSFLAACGDKAVAPPIPPATDTELIEENTICAADPTWVSAPSLPTAIPGGGTDFCQFYQFSWQTFLYLASPSSSNPGIRNFEDTANFPIKQFKENSCDTTSTPPVFFVRKTKDADNTTVFTLPEGIGQAGGGDTIYDQNGNVIFYSMMFSRDLCTAPHTGDLPANTTELKLAWRIINDTQKANYIWIDADITLTDNNDDKVTLGLIGFHSVRGTADHPELVWASFEHNANAPSCLNPAAAPAGGWSLLSDNCSTCLASPTASCFSACGYNTAAPATSLTGTPTEICRLFPEGTAPGDLKGAENISVVGQLNAQLVGPGGILSNLPATDPISVVSNYFNIGALWVNDTNVGSTNPACPAGSDCNQRGALQLANPIMETTFQGTLSLDTSFNTLRASTAGGANCFVCHAYNPGQTAEPLPKGISHIFADIPVQQ